MHVNSLEVLIGLEVHVQLTKLKSKLFCPTPADYKKSPPNTHVCPVCLGLPGTLPVVNKKAIEYAIAVAKALNCEISDRLVFVRKHYFYPDLPKNYQISQYIGPGFTAIARNGYVKIFVDGNTKVVRIRRINIEEDPGRIVYMGSIEISPYSLVDYNRSGVALLEIVTEPDMASPKEARAFLEKLMAILEYLGVTDPREEGAFRVDVNISFKGFGRVEVKNIGSVKDVEKALTYEIIRQKKIVEQGGSIERETRHWNPDKGVTIPLRSKEYEEDYRYFPDPDLPPLRMDRNFIERILSTLPELPDNRIARFAVQYGLDEYRATVLVLNKWLADFFEDAAKIYNNYKKLADLLITDFLRWINEYELSAENLKVKPLHIVKLLRLWDEGTLSVKMVKEILPQVVKEGIDIEAYVTASGYVKIIDRDYLHKIVEEVLRENPKAVQDALSNPKAINYLIGLVMKKTGGKADPQITRELIQKALEKLR
jgi:aspartyl-tRNA(Asn)/glutamyl-tRNA(Gln) amidotransferase subunit B